jgi:hypothetical protein
VIDDVYVLNDYKLINGFENIKRYYTESSLKTLYILNCGFDPRMCESIGKLQAFIPEMDILLLKNEEGYHSFSEKYHELIKENTDKLDKLKCKVEILNIKRETNILLLFRRRFNFADLSTKYGRIIIDISAMPQGIFINLINYMVKGTQKHKTIKLDVIICENSELDDAILPIELSDTAKQLVGVDTFSNSMESDEDPIPILIPLLGKSHSEELEKLFSSFAPMEICPVLPFPSKNPRRSDEILSILGKTLFEAFSVETSNIVYVAEQNVFDVYNKLCQTIRHYQEVFKNIGNPRFYISIGSSKLIGLGALLASLSLKAENITVTFVTVDNHGYQFDITKYSTSNNFICCLCLNDKSY